MIVHFNVNGNFITELARKMYYEELKPYKDVEQLLIECLQCPDLTTDEIKDLAKEIIIGKKRLTGNTADHTYNLEEDHTYDVFQYITFLSDYARRIKQDNDELKQSYEKLLSEMDDNYEDKFEIENKNVKKEEEIENKDYVDEEYGWLEPNGMWHKVDWGDHEFFAAKVVDSNKEWYKELRQTKRQKTYGDFLVNEKIGY